MIFYTPYPCRPDRGGQAFHLAATLLPTNFHNRKWAVRGIKHFPYIRNRQAKN